MLSVKERCGVTINYDKKGKVFLLLDSIGYKSVVFSGIVISDIIVILPVNGRGILETAARSRQRWGSGGGYLKEAVSVFKLKANWKDNPSDSAEPEGFLAKERSALRNVQPIRNNEVIKDDKVMVTSDEKSPSDFNESIERPLKSFLKKDTAGVNNEIMT